MSKRSDRAAKSIERKLRREEYEREEAAMQSVLEECRTCFSPTEYQRHLDEAQRYAGETLHIVEHFIAIFAATQLPITPQLRRSIDAMFETLKLDRNGARWQNLRRLNFGEYWKSQCNKE